MRGAAHFMPSFPAGLYEAASARPANKEPRRRGARRALRNWLRQYDKWPAMFEAEWTDFW